MKHLILSASNDALRSATSYAPSNDARPNGVTTNPTKGRQGLKLVHGAQHSCKEFPRHNLISNSLSIILSQWMAWILVFYPQVGPMHHPRQQVLNIVL